MEKTARRLSLHTWISSHGRIYLLDTRYSMPHFTASLQVKMAESICPCRSKEVQLQLGLHAFVQVLKEETAFIWICVRNDYYSDIAHSVFRH